MKLLLVLTLCVAATLAVPFKQSRPIPFIEYHDKSSQYDGRIIDGLPAEVGQFPWQVAVTLLRSEGNYFCGGTLISDQWVLTAAHCAQGTSVYILYLGSVTKNSVEDGRVTDATIIAYMHPDYDSDTNNHDIALVKLSQSVAFNDRIQPLDLPARGNVVGAGVPVTVSGWGKISDEDTTTSKYLNYVNLTTISNEDCAAYYGSEVIIPSKICAVGNPHHSTCNGDSGGALVVFDDSGRATNVGIASFVSSAGCASGSPSGYVRSEPYLDWISSVTGLDF